MSKNKDSVVWFVKTDNLESWAVNAKMRQLHDWVGQDNPFGDRFDVVIIPADVNKITFLKSDSEFREDFHGDVDGWLEKIRSKLEDCLTMHLSI